MRMRLFATTLALIGLKLISAPFSHAQSTCHLLTKAEATPEGFGAAYNLFSSGKENLVKVSCGSTNATMEVGNGQNATYIYRSGFEWTGSAWEPLNLTGSTLVSDTWYVGTAKANLSRTQAQLAENNFIVTYTCLRVSNSWKCGCRDSACARPYWQIQTFKVATVGGGSPGPIVVLKRDGNRLLWKGKDAGRLVGTNLEVYNNARTLDQKKTDLQNIRSLGSNLVRLNIHPGEYRAQKEAAMDRIEVLVEHSLSIGMFPIIDYHPIGMPGGWSESASWAPARHQPLYDTSVALAREFWKEAASRFQDRGGVIFEIWNEPVDINRQSGFDQQWTKFKPTWQTLINDIREQGADNFILVAGDHWARNLRGYSQDPLSDPRQNFGFAYHEYHWGEPQNATMFMGSLPDQYPFIGTEWGIAENQTAPTRSEYIKFEGEYLDKKFVGWTAWQWSDAAKPFMLTQYNPVALNAYGKYVARRIGEQNITTRP